MSKLMTFLMAGVMFALVSCWCGEVHAQSFQCAPTAGDNPKATGHDGAAGTIRRALATAIPMGFNVRAWYPTREGSRFQEFPGVVEALMTFTQHAVEEALVYAIGDHYTVVDSGNGVNIRASVEKHLCNPSSSESSNLGILTAGAGAVIIAGGYRLSLVA